MFELHIVGLILLSLISSSVSHSPYARALDDDEDGYLSILSGNQPKVTPDGDQIVEGDIVIPKENTLDGRKAVAEPVLYWPGGVIPYAYHYSVSPDEREVIERAMEHWENVTCVTFRPREGLDYMWIRFRTDSPGCWSLVGRQFLRFGVGQDISIGQGCAQLHVVAHEIGHAAGFFHEQSRSDRDNAIVVIWPNVQDGYELQFRKEEDANFGVPYDYVSVMQYPSWAFSKDVLEKNTIVTVDPRHQRFLGKNTDGLSFRDKKIANSLYSCNKGCPNGANPPCRNEGYLMPYRNDGVDCKCDCPPNTSGPFCETLLSDDYYESISPLLCGGNMTSEGVIETPNYPNRNAPRESCVWNIQAPQGRSVELQFEGFEFAPRNVKPGSKTDGKCFHEAIEIRLEDAFSGKHYCGTDIAPGTKMQSLGSQAIVIVLADEKMRGTGLRATVRFIDSVTTTTTTTPAPVNPGIWRRIVIGWQQRTTPRPWG